MPSKAVKQGITFIHAPGGCGKTVAKLPPVYVCKGIKPCVTRKKYDFAYSIPYFYAGASRLVLFCAGYFYGPFSCKMPVFLLFFKKILLYVNILLRKKVTLAFWEIWRYFSAKKHAQWSQTLLPVSAARKIHVRKKIYASRCFGTAPLPGSPLRPAEQGRQIPPYIPRCRWESADKNSRIRYSFFILP